MSSDNHGKPWVSIDIHPIAHFVATRGAFPKRGCRELGKAGALVMAAVVGTVVAVRVGCVLACLQQHAHTQEWQHALDINRQFDHTRRARGRCSRRNGRG